MEGIPVTRRDSDLTRRRGQTRSIVLALLVALLPKCPCCWAAYGSLFCTVGIARFSFYGWVFPVTATLLVGNLAWMGIRMKGGKNCWPLILGLAGCLAVIASKLANGHSPVAYGGVALIALSAVWDAFLRALGAGGLRAQRTSRCGA